MEEFPLDEQEDTTQPPSFPTAASGDDTPTPDASSPLISTPVTPTVPDIAPVLPDDQYVGEAFQPPMPLPYASAPVTPLYSPPPLPYAPPNPPQPSQPLGAFAPPPLAYMPSPPGPAPILPPVPNYYGGYQPGVPMIVPGRPEHPSRTAAIIAEVILDLFGIYGVGWLIAGETTTGIILLIASFFWWSVAVLITIFTVGVGVICILPLNLIFLLLSVILLAQRTAARAY